MSYAFPEGAKFLFSQTIGAAVVIETMSNADPVVCHKVGHGFVDGDELVLDSPWEDITDSIFRADMMDADNLRLVDLDTTDTDLFSPGGGASSTLRKITNWIEIPQVLNVDTSGGDPIFSPIKPLSRRQGFTQPTGFNPATIVLDLGHDSKLAAYKTMKQIGRKQKKLAFKQVLVDGSTTYGFGYMAVSEIPSLKSGEPNKVKATLSLCGRAIEYAGA